MFGPRLSVANACSDRLNNTVHVTVLTGARLRVAKTCVGRLSRTPCVPESHSSVEAIVFGMLCERVCFSIPHSTAFVQTKFELAHNN